MNVGEETQLGSFIRLLRKRQRLTQVVLGQKVLGTSNRSTAASYICRLERNDIQTPDQERLRRLASLLDMTKDEEAKFRSLAGLDNTARAASNAILDEAIARARKLFGDADLLARLEDLIDGAAPLPVGDDTSHGWDTKRFSIEKKPLKIVEKSMMDKPQVAPR